MENNVIFDSEWLTYVADMGVELHRVTAALKIMVKKCAQLEQEIRQLKNGNGNKV